MFQQNINNKELYEILGVSNDASSNDIKKAYRKLAMKYHPDRSSGKTEEEKKNCEDKFKKISAAYDILSDEQKKQKYDQFGMDGLNAEPSFNMGNMGNPFDMFGNIFNQHMGQKQRQQIKRGKDRIEIIHVSLQEIYTESDKIIELNRNKKCIDCDGKGGLEQIVCSICEGKGIILKIQQMGPGFISQSQQPCHKCLQSGKIIPENKKCNTCKGNGYIDSQQKLKLRLSKTSVNGEKIILPEKSHYNPHVDVQGNLIIVLNIQKHSDYTVEDYHLIKKEKITLLEALCGVKKVIVLPDNTICWYKINQVIKPNHTYCIPNKGLKDKNNNVGNIILDFDIIFPDSIDNERKIYISKLLKKYDTKTEQPIEYNENDEVPVIPWIRKKRAYETNYPKQKQRHRPPPEFMPDEDRDGNPIECNQQ